MQKRILPMRWMLRRNNYFRWVGFWQAVRDGAGPVWKEQPVLSWETGKGGSQGAEGKDKGQGTWSSRGRVGGGSAKSKAMLRKALSTRWNLHFIHPEEPAKEFNMVRFVFYTNRSYLEGNLAIYQES